MAGFRAPAVGELRHRVILQDRSQAPGAGGGITETFATVATVAARIEALFGGRVIEGRQTQEVATHNITVRYLSGWAAVDHVLFGTRLFRVRSVLNPHERNVWLELLCEELRQ